MVSVLSCPFLHFSTFVFIFSNSAQVKTTINQLLELTLLTIQACFKKHGPFNNLRALQTFNYIVESIIIISNSNVATQDTRVS